MSSGTVSVRYAKALLQYAEEQGCQAEVYDRMLQLTACIRLLPDIMGRLNDPTVGIEDKGMLLAAAVADCDGRPACAPLQDFLKLVVRKGRADALPFIASSYRNLYRDRYGIVPVELVTATSVNDTQRTELKKFIGDKTNRTVEWSERVDSKLMGGFVLQVDDYRLDASVARRLRIIEKELIEKNSRII